MRLIKIVLIIIAFLLVGCVKKSTVPDYKFIVGQLVKDNFYKLFINEYIICRDGGNQYFYRSDSLLLFIFHEENGKAVVADEKLRNAHRILEEKSISNPEAYINKIVGKASILIPFMRKNGIQAVSGFISESSGEFLYISLENHIDIFYSEKNYKDFKSFKLNDSVSYNYVDEMGNWLIMQRKDILNQK